VVSLQHALVVLDLAIERTLQKDVGADHQADDLDLDIGNAVAVDVALQETIGKAQLPIQAGEATRADKGEGLVAARPVRVGVDRAEVDPV
jgi:hypothetical protein